MIARMAAAFAAPDGRHWRWLYAALVGVLFLGEALTGMQLVAFAIALASVLLATLPSRAALRVGRGDRPDRS